MQNHYYQNFYIMIQPHNDITTTNIDKLYSCQHNLYFQLCISLHAQWIEQ